MVGMQTCIKFICTVSSVRRVVVILVVARNIIVIIMDHVTGMSRFFLLFRFIMQLFPFTFQSSTSQQSKHLMSIVLSFILFLLTHHAKSML